MTTPYTHWKEQHSPSIYKEAWRPHMPTIVMMILDRIKEKHILKYLKDELGLKQPKKALRECREWAYAPDPTQFDVPRKKRKTEVMEMLMRMWQKKCKVPYSEEALASWVPAKALEYPYDEICQHEAEMEEERLQGALTQFDESMENFGDLLKTGLEDEDDAPPFADPDLDNEVTLENCLIPEEFTDGDTPSLERRLLSPPQKHALKELTDAYTVAERAKDLELPIIPRTNCLMVGPSGSGKTFLARAFANQMNLPFMSVNVSSWTLICSRSESQNYTLVQIAAFIMTIPGGVIYLDEVDKIDGTNSWNKHLQLEIHSLLDGEIGMEVIDGLEKRLETEVSLDFLEALNKSLKKDFFIVAGGTWQNFWETRSKSSVGFNSVDETRKLDKKELTKHITAELLQRFQQSRILLEPITKEEFLMLAEKVAEQLDHEKNSEKDENSLKESFLQAVEDGVDLAVDEKTGMRFLEECITEALKPRPGEKFIE